MGVSVGPRGGRRPREVPSTLIPWTLLLGNPGAWPQGANYVRGLELSLSLSPRGWMTPGLLGDRELKAVNQPQAPSMRLIPPGPGQA